MHWHSNHFAYIFEDDNLEVRPPRGEVTKISAKAGDVAWMDSGHHEAVNKSRTDFHALVVEFKRNTEKLGK